MKLTRGSVLPVAGVALVVGLFAWAWIGTARHHSNPVHMGYAVQQMHGEMQNGTMPISTMHMDDMDMASMHEAMLDDGAPMAQMPMTAAQLSHMKSMGMGSTGMVSGKGVDANGDHKDHHGPGR